MKISFNTLGCKLNFAESSSLGRALIANGHTIGEANSQTDVCIINTCSVTDTADHKDRQTIHSLRRRCPQAILIVTGCYAQLRPQEIISMPEVDYVLGMNEKFDIPSFIDRLEKQVVNKKQIFTSAIREINEYHPAFSRDDRTRCFLKVQDGCNNFCTYCTIPLARGKSRNPSIKSIVETACQAIQQGAKELVLSGVNIGDFGHSTFEHFIDLLRALDCMLENDTNSVQCGTDYRIRISSCEPDLLTNEIIDFVASSKHFTPHFHIPLQSGCDAMLKIMHRRYDTALFRERIEHIKKVMPNAFIGVDCMVGVRGETEEYFQEYINFVQSLPVSQLHVFTYSERANTKMIAMDLCVVPTKERKRRSDLLHEISSKKLKDFYAAHEGDEAVVLWESKRERNDSTQSPTYLMAGFTENYIRLVRPYDPSRINTFERVKIAF